MADDELLLDFLWKWQSPARTPNAAQLRTQEPLKTALGLGVLRFFAQGSTVNGTEITCTRKPSGSQADTKAGLRGVV
jgi:hypothetical protein